MKITNGEIFGAVQALGELSNKELPVKFSYWLARLINKLDGSYKAIEKVRNDLVQKHGEKNEKGQFEVKQGGSKWEAFATEFNELMVEEVEVDVSPIKLPLKLPAEADGKPILIKTSVLAPLEKFVEIIE